MQYLPFYLIAVALLPSAIAQTVQLYRRFKRARKRAPVPRWSPTMPPKRPPTADALIMQWKIEERRREGEQTLDPIDAVDVPACLTTGVHPAIRMHDTTQRFRAITGHL